MIYQIINISFAINNMLNSWTRCQIHNYSL